MVTTALLVALVGYADSTDIAHRVQIHLSATAQPWAMRNARKLRKVAPRGEEMVFEVELNRRGGFTRVKPSWSGSRKAIRLGRGLFRVAPPLSDPPKAVKKSRKNIPCVVYVRLQGKPRKVDVASVCLPKGSPPQVAQREGVSMGSPSAEIFQGWNYEATGALPKALGAFRSATEADPKWTLASLAFGLSLARSGRLDDARPHLKQGVKKRRPTREVRRYLKGKDYTSTAGGTGEGSGAMTAEDDDASFGACQRDEGEIFRYIKRQFRKLNKCVNTEKDKNPKMPPALPVSFVIMPNGKVRDVLIDHRYYREGGQLTQCVDKSLKGKLKKEGGSDCPVEFEVGVEGES